MSFIRPQLAARLVPYARPSSKYLTRGPIRLASSDTPSSSAPTQPAQKTSPSDAPGARPEQKELVTNQNASEGLVSHEPDWTAPIDHGTSQFSPVPKRVMDGSEPGDITPAAVLSGAPVELQGRVVRIYRPAKTATQSGDWHGHQWRMDWDILQKGHRWENPLMGWQSSGDFMQGTHLNFKSKDDAIRFAQKQGYEYFVQEPNERQVVPKAYANNFMHSPKKLKKIPTK